MDARIWGLGVLKRVERVPLAVLSVSACQRDLKVTGKQGFAVCQVITSVDLGQS